MRGNGNTIQSDDTTPRLGDNTDFGELNAGGSPAEKTYTIHNIGQGSLSLTANPRVQISGAVDFSLVMSPSQSIAAGNSSNFIIRFNPSSTGIKRATVSIPNSDTDENPHRFDIRGLVVTPFASGPWVTSFGPPIEDLDAGVIDHVVIRFDKVIDASSFSAGDITLTRNGSSVPITSVERLTNVSFKVSFPIQRDGGSFDATVGPLIADTLGNFMNQDQDLTNAEDPGDRYAASFTLPMRDPPPANDAFANRVPISEIVATVKGLNIGATKESAEPNHAGNVGGKSVWWTWTAPTTGIFQIDTNGSGFDTTLAVYSGDDLPSLKMVVSDNDGGSNGTSKVVFNAVPTTYQIAVDGFNGATGTISLSIAPQAITGKVLDFDRDDVEPIDVKLSRFDDGDPIDPTRPTWIIIHGRVADPANPTQPYMDELVAAVGDHESNDQVLVLDWKEGADDPRFGGELWITDVAKWTADRLRDLLIPAENVRLIGHSWGSHAAYHIARELNSGVAERFVRAIVALDPAPIFYTGVRPNFREFATFSWGFNSSLWTGNNNFAQSAHEGFNVTVGDPFGAAHWDVVYLFATMIERNNRDSPDSVSRWFSLSRLLAGAAFGGARQVWDDDVEADIHATKVGDEWQPLSMSFSIGGRPAQVFVAGNLPDNIPQWTPRNLTFDTPVRDWVGTLDRYDYYRLVVTSSRTVTITLTGLSDNVDLYLHRAARRGIAVFPSQWHHKASLNAGADAETIQVTLEPGCYYVRVQQGNGWANTYYDLSITETTAAGNHISLLLAASLIEQESQRDPLRRWSPLARTLR